MANEQNLRTPSTSEAREIGHKGGMASAKSRRDKKLLRETLEMIMTMPVKSGKDISVEEIQNFAAIKGKNISVQEAVMIAQVKKAMKGDTKAAEYLRDTLGQKSSEKIELEDMELHISIDYGETGE